MSHGIICRTALFELLDHAGRVTEVTAPPGSGKTTLLRSWIDGQGLTGRAAHLSTRGKGHDPQRFWIAVADALRGTVAGSELVRPLTAAPDLDGWMVVEHLLAELAPLRERIWLIIDDLHELTAPDALGQLRLLLTHGPAELRFVLAARHDIRLGLHRLRLDGELSEIRTASLRFTLEEARELFTAAGLCPSEKAVMLLHQRTEGWAAGLRLAALSLVGHPDPERFASEFSGSDRTVAEYLLAEVLEQQAEPVRRLLLLTSVLDRVNGPLADLLTGGAGGERILLDLESTGAFVLAVDPRRSWFRYHGLFADLLQLELRRTGAAEPSALHGVAAGWYAAQGYPVEAVRHAQAAHDWELAARLLCEHWGDLYPDGQVGIAHELLAGFPASVVAGDAGITALMAALDLDRGSLDEAERRLALAAAGSDTVPADRRGRFEVITTVLRLRLARRQGDLPAVVREAQTLRATIETAVDPDLGDGLRALALLSLGVAEASMLGAHSAELHLERGIDLARRIGRPYLELVGLVYAAHIASTRSYAAGAELSGRAIVLAGRHGWADRPITAIAWAVRADVLIVQGQLTEAELWLERAQRALQSQVNLAASVNLHCVRAGLELGRGEYTAALATLRAVEPLACTPAAPHSLRPILRAHTLHALIQLGKTQTAERALAALPADERDAVPARIAEAALRLAQDNPRVAREVLGSLASLTDAVPADVRPMCSVAVLLLEAKACDRLGLPDEARSLLERALDAAAPDHVLLPFLVHRAPGLLERHAGGGTAHVALISELLERLAPNAIRPLSNTAPAAAGTTRTTARPGAAGRDPSSHAREPLSRGEMRVLRYLPTNLSAPEIAAELSLSVNTIRTHMRHVYEKLGAHSRNEAVRLARSLGLVAGPTSALRATNLE